MPESGHEPLEIWLFDDAPILGGAELFALRLARFAAGRGSPRLRMICPPESALAQRCAEAGIELLPASFPPLGPLGVPRWPKAVMRVRALLAQAGPQAIAVGNTARAQAYLVAASILGGRRGRIVHVLHEQDTLARPSGRAALRRVGALVAIGENVAAACRERLPGVSVRKANNFLDPPDLVAGAPRLPVGAEPVLGALTRLIPEKGVLDLVEDLAVAGSWSRALIGGGAQDPDYARRVEDRIAALGLNGRVSLLGHVENVAEFLDSIDALVVPSTGNEGQPTVIIEALARGRPCLVRSAVWSRDFEDLPVLPFDGPSELENRLLQLPAEPAPAEEFRRRFGPEQALDAILAAAGGRGP